MSREKRSGLLEIDLEETEIRAVFYGHLTREQAVVARQEWEKKCGPPDIFNFYSLDGNDKCKVVMTHQWARWGWHNEDGERMHRLNWNKERKPGTFAVTVFEESWK